MGSGTWTPMTQLEPRSLGCTPTNSCFPRGDRIPHPRPPNSTLALLVGVGGTAGWQLGVCVGDTSLASFPRMTHPEEGGGGSQTTPADTKKTPLNVPFSHLPAPLPSCRRAAMEIGRHPSSPTRATAHPRLPFTRLKKNFANFSSFS